MFAMPAASICWISKLCNVIKAQLLLIKIVYNWSSMILLYRRLYCLFPLLQYSMNKYYNLNQKYFKRDGKRLQEHFVSCYVLWCFYFLNRLINTSASFYTKTWTTWNHTTFETPFLCTQTRFWSVNISPSWILRVIWRNLNDSIWVIRIKSLIKCYTRNK